MPDERDIFLRVGKGGRIEPMGKGKAGASFGATVRKRSVFRAGARAFGHWKMECRRGGELIWTEEWENLVVTEGLNHVLDVTLSAAAQITSWFVGLKGAGAVVAGDTIAAQTNWTEVTDYTGTRPAWTDGGVTAGSVDNSGSPAVLVMTGTATVAGAFLCSVASGTTGTLYAAGDYSVSRDLIADDELTVTATFTMADDGV